jgi:hypothetical protein
MEYLPVHICLGLLGHLLLLGQPSLLIICALLEMSKKTENSSWKTSTNRNHYLKNANGSWLLKDYQRLY